MLVMLVLGATSAPNEVAYNHEWDTPRISTNREREAAIDEPFLVWASAQDTTS